MKTTSKQTAVEWLFNELDNILELYPSEWEKVSNAVEQAKEMEKEQIKDSWVNAWQESMINPLEYKFYEPEAEQYYKETYESNI
jgi:hypothetical protein